MKSKDWKAKIKKCQNISCHSLGFKLTSSYLEDWWRKCETIFNDNWDLQKDENGEYIKILLRDIESLVRALNRSMNLDWNNKNWSESKILTEYQSKYEELVERYDNEMKINKDTDAIADNCNDINDDIFKSQIYSYFSVVIE